MRIWGLIWINTFFSVCTYSPFSHPALFNVLSRIAKSACQQQIDQQNSTITKTHAQGKELHIPNGKLQNCGNIFQGSAIAKEHCATEIPCFHVFLCLISCNQNLPYLCDFHMHCYSGKRNTKVMKITKKRDIIARIVVRKLLLQMFATNRSPGRWQYF